MTVVVISTGPQCTLQDLGRPGFAALGVGRSGAFDRTAARRANRLVGNDEGGVVIECLLGGLRLRAEQTTVFCVTGDGPVTVAGRAAGAESTLTVAAGAELEVGAGRGLRRYVAVRGGLRIEPVLGSASTDTLTGLGPAPIAAGDVLPVGAAPSPVPSIDQAPVAPVDHAAPVVLDAVPGPRLGRLAIADRRGLSTIDWTVGSRADRVGVRLDGPPLRLTATGELPSEGLRPGSVQVTADGLPMIFGPDHPVTGGYPVIAVLTAASLDRLAQLGPGRRVRLRVGPMPRWADVCD